MSTRTDRAEHPKPPERTANTAVSEDLLQMARVISGHKKETIREVLERHLRSGRPGGLPREYREVVAAMASDLGGEG